MITAATFVLRRPPINNSHASAVSDDPPAKAASGHLQPKSFTTRHAFKDSLVVVTLYTANDGCLQSYRATAILCNALVFGISPPSSGFAKRRIGSTRDNPSCCQSSTSLVLAEESPPQSTKDQLLAKSNCQQPIVLPKYPSCGPSSNCCCGLPG